jgi:phosphoesterase RecJ-like protein
MRDSLVIQLGETMMNIAVCQSHQALVQAFNGYWTWVTLKSLEVFMSPSIANSLKSAQSVILSTHRNCDGDGLGAQIAMFHGLKQLGKEVRIINVDKPAKKYDFLNTGKIVEVLSPGMDLGKVDVALIFDTNDARRVEPLFSDLAAKTKSIFFVDHHPVLKKGPAPTSGSLIDISAASTGEMAYRILLALEVRFNAEIARALYTALVFDTQLFRYVKSDPRSHEMAADLLCYEKNPQEVHRALFATYTVEKMKFLALALSQVRYFANDRLAFIKVDSRALLSAGLDLEETGDVIDLVMNIESVEAAALVREDGPKNLKLSFRSKGTIPVLPIAEKWGGGGHPFAAGANVDMDVESLQVEVEKQFLKALNAVDAKLLKKVSS